MSRWVRIRATPSLTRATAEATSAAWAAAHAWSVPLVARLAVRGEDASV